ncbi:MAG TPA: glycosyltransferase [Candidatus Korarchaeota archaeon]|nr:glycosyltransferase [Candidatus Korarchaeota archaeon]
MKLDKKPVFHKNFRNLKVLFLQPQPCIRALKYAKGLRWALKDRIKLIFGYIHQKLSKLYGYGDEFFDHLEKLNVENLEGSVRKLVEKYRPHLVHSHNAPDFLTVAAIEAVGGSIPIIHDCHEALSLRSTGYYLSDDEKKIFEVYPREERIAIERSDARIYVSEGMRDYIQSKYRVNPERDMVFYSYVSKSVIPRKLREKLSEKDGGVHLVYIGTLTGLKKENQYYLIDIFRSIAEAGMHIHIYPSGISREDKSYAELARESRMIHYHGYRERKKLLLEITQYDFGWAGFNSNEKNKRHVDVALPNKIFEYIACGLPVLAFPHKTIRNFLERHGVGFVFEEMEELVGWLRERGDSEVRERTLRSRYRFTIERNIGRVLRFYGEVSGIKGIVPLRAELA